MNSKKNIIRRHEAMVDDPLRTPILEQAITRLVKPGDVVFDLGCGLGILTRAALKAGASHVYACEIDESIVLARENIKKAGYEKKVTFFNELSSEVELPEKVDVILAETVGTLGLNENIMPFVADARSRFLKKTGVILPQRLQVFIAPCDFVLPKQNLKNSFCIEEIPFQSLLAPAQIYHDVSFLKNTKYGVDQELVFQIKRSGRLMGLAVWFTATWAPGFQTLTVPGEPLTHWKQGFLPVESTSLRSGEKIVCRLIMGPDEEIFSTESLVEWGWKKI